MTSFTLLHQEAITSEGLFFERSLNGQSCCSLSAVSCRVMYGRRLASAIKQVPAHAGPLRRRRVDG